MKRNHLYFHIICRVLFLFYYFHIYGVHYFIEKFCDDKKKW